jgi:hypothetical protein
VSNVLIAVNTEELVRWAAAARLADSYMSLVYHRQGIERWDTAATPERHDWEKAMGKARQAADEMAASLKDFGIDDRAVAAEMRRNSWEPQPHPEVV